MDWIQLAQDTDQWRDLVNTTKDIWIEIETRGFLSTWDTISFQESSCSLCMCVCVCVCVCVKCSIAVSGTELQ